MQFFLALCCLFSISQVAKAHGCDFDRSTRDPQKQNSLAPVPDSQFAIGDFDGDRQPDLATVEIARFNSLHSRYSISLQLSKGGPQRLGITAPAGGLALLARDVNGDRALDVVLVTAWRHEFVAVLLNDGAGNFAPVDPARFRFDTVSSTAQLEIVPKRLDDGTILAVQYSLTGDLDGHTWAGPNQQSKLACPRSLELVNSLSQSSILGRAPPPSLLHT